MFKTIKIIPRWLTDSLFPKICRYCGDTFSDGLANVLCRSCFELHPRYEEPVCDHCGFPLPDRGFEDAPRKRCSDCGDGEFQLDHVRSYGSYEGSLRIAHHAFKFEGMESFKKDIVLKMLETIPDEFWKGVDCLCPIPMSSDREREKGYNPSYSLVEEISKRKSIPMKRLLYKTRVTKPQMSLSKKDRLENPKGSYGFMANQGKGGSGPRNVLLVDDVFTTGATLEECARILKVGGIVWVGALVFGRTPHH